MKPTRANLRAVAILRETLPEALARGLLPSAEPERVPAPAGECPF